MGWQMPAKLASYDFRSVTSEENPHTGKRCTRLSRAPGRHYGEVAGFLSQQLDATAYRNRRIILKAAARAELSGRENRAWLRLFITRKTSDPAEQGMVFDTLDQYPVRSAEWQTFQITADVPQDADAISYGLYLVGDGDAWLDSVSLEATGK